MGIWEIGIRNKTVGAGPVLRTLEGPVNSAGSVRSLSFVEGLSMNGWGGEAVALPKEGAASSAPTNPQSEMRTLFYSALTPFPFLNGEKDSLSNPQGSIGKGPRDHLVPPRIKID